VALAIPDQRGRAAVVTGANSGLGYETALGLARAGARIVMAARDAVRGAAAADRLRVAVPGAHVDVAQLDLADLGSVREFAVTVAEQLPDGLDLLVNNAGVMAVPQRRTTAQGLELQIGTNHFGHFALTLALLPLLVRRAGARVITVTSLAHRWSRGLRHDDLQRERSYSAWAAYSDSKLANALFTVELDRRLQAAETTVLSLGAHPGLAATNLHVSGPRLGGGGLMARVVGLLGRAPLLTQSPEGGAAPTLMAAGDPGAAGGRLYGPCCFGETQGRPTVTAFSGPALDPDAGRRLWVASERITEARFPAA
jgi:NAD(P)-dependent dehydrogenase (short-subunit alcohol dehydrogenase family)